MQVKLTIGERLKDLRTAQKLSLEQLAAEGWELREVTHDLHANGPVGVMTDYEAKFYDQGITINRCVAVKTEDTKCDLYPGTSTGCAPV